MINKDYILRIAERLGREISIILGLRQRDKQEEALLYIDDLLLNTVGLTSRFINSLTEEALLQVLSPLGVLNINSCLWIAAMLKIEGEIYAERQQESEAYYRSLKSLHLYLAALAQEPGIMQGEIPEQVEELLHTLAAYEMPATTQKLLFRYYEYSGQYARAEDTLFGLLETPPFDQELYTQGGAFYQRLLHKNAQDLVAGNFSQEEAEEGLSALQRLPHTI
jgi:tetratricopeptide (TPR) repeat protein